MNNMKWTLTKDSLPPEPVKMYESCHYLATVINNKVVPVEYCKTKLRNKEVVRWQYLGTAFPREVIAWMPFPSAYIEK